MSKKLVNGKYMAFEEGVLSFVGTEGSRSHYKSFTRKAHRVRRNGTTTAKMQVDAPGWNEWISRHRSDDIALSPKGSYGRPMGQPDGISKGEMMKKDELIASLFGDDEEDIIEIAEFIKQEANPMARLAFRRWCRMILMGSSDRDIQKALTEMIAYNKSKPVMKQEVKVSEVEAAWGEEVDADALLLGKGNCQTPN